MTREAQHALLLSLCAMGAACGSPGGGRSTTSQSDSWVGGGSGGDSDSRRSSPTWVTVRIEGALVAAWKNDRDCWDTFFCSASATEYAALISLVAGPSSYNAVLGGLAESGVKTTAKPDAAGWAELVGGVSMADPVQLPKNQDSLIPGWGGGWSGVELNDDTAIRVEVWDLDIENDDLIGTAIIGSDDLWAALDSGGVYHVPVADQTHNQLLFVDISVLE